MGVIQVIGTLLAEWLVEHRWLIFFIAMGAAIALKPFVLGWIGVRDRWAEYSNFWQALPAAALAMYAADVFAGKQDLMGFSFASPPDIWAYQVVPLVCVLIAYLDIFIFVGAYDEDSY